MARPRFPEPETVPGPRAARSAAGPLDGVSRIDVQTHLAVLTRVLQRPADAGLIKGKTVGIAATTLEANAALRGIVRRDTVRVATRTPTRAELARFDRKRPRRVPTTLNASADPDAKITKMIDGRAHLVHKAEHAVDVEPGAVVRVAVEDADAGDTTMMIETLITAAEQIEAVLPDGAGLAEMATRPGARGWTCGHDVRPEPRVDGRMDRCGRRRSSEECPSSVCTPCSTMWHSGAGLP